MCRTYLLASVLSPFKAALGSHNMIDRHAMGTNLLKLKPEVKFTEPWKQYVTL